MRGATFSRLGGLAGKCGTIHSPIDYKWSDFGHWNAQDYPNEEQLRIPGDLIRCISLGLRTYHLIWAL